MRRETLKALAVPFLRAIRNKMTETYGLSVLDEKRPASVVVESITGPDYVCFSIETETATPLHTSAPGKALVAALPEKRRNALIKRLVFRSFTPNTITTREAFKAEINSIRRQGYATDLSEEIEGCHCGGVAILDPKRIPVAALWVTGMAKRLPAKQLRTCIRHLQTAGLKIEKELVERALSATKAKPLSPCVAAAKDALATRPSGTADYAALAKASGVSYSTLRTAFRSETGVSLDQYHLALRLGEARRLLAQTAQSITEIAALTGFCNQKHFSAIFKRKTGCAPHAYRKRNRPAAAE